MIELKIEDYCQGCPFFEPVAENIVGYADNVRGVIGTNVLCENRDKCAHLKKHLEKGAMLLQGTAVELIDYAKEGEGVKSDGII